MEIKRRESNFELLRIIAIIMVITSHFVVHGGIKGTNSIYFINTMYSRIMILGCIANHIFIFLSGYFLVKSNFNIRKVIKLILEMTFYSLIIFLIYSFTIHDFNLLSFIKNFFAIFWGNWFVKYYIILYLIFPYLNIIVNKLDKNKFIELILLLIFIVYGISTVTHNCYGFNNIVIFIVDYFIGAYLHLYETKKYKFTQSIKFLLYSFLICILSVLLLYAFGKMLSINKLIESPSYLISNDYSIVTLLCAYLIFLFFKNIKINENKIINYVSKSVLGIYLIHDNYYVRNFIWNIFLPNSDFYNKIYFIIFAILKIMLIFLICLSIDIIRRLLFDKVENKISEKIIYFTKKNNTLKGIKKNFILNESE